MEKGDNPCLSDESKFWELTKEGARTPSVRRKMEEKGRKCSQEVVDAG
jgi:hypothetical protein